MLLDVDEIRSRLIRPCRQLTHQDAPRQALLRLVADPHLEKKPFRSPLPYRPHGVAGRVSDRIVFRVHMDGDILLVELRFEDGLKFLLVNRSSTFCEGLVFLIGHGRQRVRHTRRHDWPPNRLGLFRLSLVPEIAGSQNRNNLKIDQIIPASDPRSQRFWIRSFHKLEATDTC